LNAELNLTKDQKAKVKPILEKLQPKLQAIHQDAITKSKAAIESTNGELKPLLTPEQQQKLDKIQQRMNPSPTPAPSNAAPQATPQPATNGVRNAM
jgi:Spy/CpxP family protein refolding chaperone